MPTQDQHRAKAEQNFKFLQSISLDDYPDWVVVAAFYTAVHLVEELRAACGDGHSVGHEDRLAYIQERHAEIHTSYHILQNAAWLARYESNKSFFAAFQREDIQDRLLRTYLAQVKAYVTARIQNRVKSP